MAVFRKENNGIFTFEFFPDGQDIIKNQKVVMTDELQQTNSFVNCK